MRRRSELRAKQQIIINEIKRNKARLIVSAMGSGKTGATLTAVADLLAEGKIKRVLVVAPLLVATNTWPDEIAEWEHTRHLTFAVACGDQGQRLEALKAHAQITIINRENLVWLARQIGSASKWPYDCVIVDESSMFKAGKKRTTRGKVKQKRVCWRPAYRGKPIYRFMVFDDKPDALRHGHDHIGRLLGDLTYLGVTKDGTVTRQSVRKGGNMTRFGVVCAARPRIGRIYLLTGTPAPNGVHDLWGQGYLMDGGQRLEKSITAFENRWFTKNQYTREITPRPGAEKEIMALMSEMMVSIPPDQLVPPPVYIPRRIDLDQRVQKEYRDFEKTLFAQPYDVEAVSQGVLANKLLQFANGSLYHEDGHSVPVHDEKLKALDELVEEAAGENILVFYSFKFDLEAIRRRYPEAVVLNEEPDAVKKWNAGKIKMLLAHPASCAHGLNMQYGGHIAIWYGLNWSLELFQQANARLPRPGQKHIVAIYMIIARDTYDENVSEVLQEKGVTQDRIVESVKIRIGVS